MSIASNLYAARVFSEHPTASWPLDDDVSYISLITEQNRDLTTWTINSGSAVSVNPLSYPDAPFFDSSLSQLTAAGASVVMSAISPNIFNLQNLNQDMNVFSINFYTYTIGVVNYYEYGYRYLDPYLSVWIEDVNRIENVVADSWVRIGDTFNPPNLNADVQIIFRAAFSSGSSPYVIFNGLSVGQWSETTNAVTLGSTPEIVNNELQNILSPSTMGIPIQAYGISENDGYILVEDNKLLAKNHGIPMVYGSDNITRLYTSASGLPSVVVPSMGVLNKSGQYNTSTVEMWIRLENNSTIARRIWGPLNSDYGLYVRGEYLALVIGNSIGSYFVADWYRPMLLDIVIKENAAKLILNGEEVISIEYETDSLTLPEIDEDWMGFYCYSNMPIFEIDCVSVLPYEVPEAVAKRRFVWGQGVENPETINSAYQGTVAYIDYPFAEYTSNYAYPDKGNWDSAYFENLSATRQSLSVPNYELPIIELGEKTLQNLYDDNKAVNDTEHPSVSAIVTSASALTGEIIYTTSASHAFEVDDRVTVTGALISDFNITSTITAVSASTFTMVGNASGSALFNDGFAISNHPKFIMFRPNSTWTDPAYYLFPSMNMITDVVRAVWGIFEVSASTSSTEPLMIFSNKNTGDSIRIEITGLNVTYKFYRRGQLYDTSFTMSISLDTHFAVGFHFPRLFEKWRSVIGEFFSNPSAIQIFIGGDGINTFSGSIYRIGFSNQTSLNQIDDHFYDSGQYQGLAKITGAELLNYHLGSYSLFAIEDFNRFYLDIGVSSYWEEYYPLSIFAGYTTDKNGNTIYDLDFLQYNIGYPSIESIVKNTSIGTWTYQQLYDEYNAPAIRSYEELDNYLLTGYEDYSDLANRAQTSKYYDFSQSSVRSYVTFQPLSGGANNSLSDYSVSESIPSSRVLNVPSYSNQFGTKFEIVNQSIIYPPTTLGINATAMVLHLDIKVAGIKTNPLNIRKMSFVSKTLNGNNFSQIGTRFGQKLYPYSKNGIYYDYTRKNPYSIYKDSSPYLFLTKHSGIKSLGSTDFNLERGIAFPVNEQVKDDYQIGAMQVWMKYDGETIPQVPITLFSIDASNIKLSFQITSDQTGERGYLSAINTATDEIYTGLVFYQDGIQVLNPYLEKDKWTVIGIRFSGTISFNQYLGSINLFQSATFNDIAYYVTTKLQKVQSSEYRKWLNISYDESSASVAWNFWSNYVGGSYKDKSWNNVLVLKNTESIYGVNPETLYKSYTGTNRYIIDDEKSLVVSNDGVTMLMGANWVTYTQKPV